MTPDLERAFRLNPRVRKQVRERTAALLAALEVGQAETIQQASASWAEAEKEAEADVARKRARPPMHRVSFLIEETHYRSFCETALEHELTPSEVARRYCISGYTFASLIWGTVRRGGSVAEWVRVSGQGPNLAELALPDFSGDRPVGTR